MTTYPGPDSAYFSLFRSAPSMDNRAVRLSGVLSFCVAVACAVFAERYVTEWVVSGNCCCFGSLLLLLLLLLPLLLLLLSSWSSSMMLSLIKFP